VTEDPHGDAVGTQGGRLGEHVDRGGRRLAPRREALGDERVARVTAGHRAAEGPKDAGLKAEQLVGDSSIIDRSRAHFEHYVTLAAPC
jgi:hypothetical protein